MDSQPPALFAPRRSPRTIEKLFKGIQMGELTQYHTRILLSLAQCSGWSADHIRIRMKEVTGKTIKAEDIWSFHWRWIMDRGNQFVGRKEIKIMLAVLKEEGITLSEIGRTLHTREQPISVPFVKAWKANVPDALPLCKGHTAVARTQNRAYLSSRPISQYAKFSPSEEPFILQFGSTVQRLMKETLEAWVEAIKVRMEERGLYKDLKDREDVYLIMEHLKDYHQKYEDIYGEMESQTLFGKMKDGTVHIRSTGYGVKVLLGLMMADRLHVIEKLRREARERICFEKVHAADLPEDSMNCSICQDPLDIETPEGTMEEGLKLIICCQQVIGENCLKAWLARSGPSIRKNCPNCRFDFPPCFMVKLFGEEYPMDVDTEDEVGDDDDTEGTIVVQGPGEVVGLVGPSPGSEENAELEDETEDEPEYEPDYDPQPELARDERSPAPSPIPQNVAELRDMILSVSPEPFPRPAVDAEELMRGAFMNQVHTHIPQGPDGLPDFAAAWSFGGPQVGQADDFMMEG